MIRIICLVWVSLGLCVLSPSTTLADTEPIPACGERYYFILFAGTGEVLRPATAHVWATWVRATTLPDNTIQIHETTISFLPKTLRVRWWAVRPEPGFNLGLHETFQFMTPNHALRTRISMWGPFEITAPRYDQGIRQKQHLDTGTVLFRSIDYFDQARIISNTVCTRSRPRIPNLIVEHNVYVGTATLAPPRSRIIFRKQASLKVVI